MVGAGRSGGWDVDPIQSVTADPRGPANLGPGSGAAGGLLQFTGTEADGVQPPEAEANGAALVVKFDRASVGIDQNSRSRGEALSSHNTPTTGSGDGASLRRLIAANDYPPQPGDRTLPLASISLAA